MYYFKILFLNIFGVLKSLLISEAVIDNDYTKVRAAAENCTDPA